MATQIENVQSETKSNCSNKLKSKTLNECFLNRFPMRKFRLFFLHKDFFFLDEREKIRDVGKNAALFKGKFIAHISFI